MRRCEDCIETTWILEQHAQAARVCERDAERPHSAEPAFCKNPARRTVVECLGNTSFTPLGEAGVRPVPTRPTRSRRLVRDGFVA